MAIPISNVTRRVVYAASGTGPYAFTFEILANTDIAVYRDDTLLTLTTNYTVTINSNGTGSITLTAAPTGATQIAIVGNRTIQRTTDFVTGGDFFANTVNDEMDQQTIFAQQNAEGLSRALQAPQTDPTTINMTLPRKADRAGKYLAFDSNGNPEPGPTSQDVDTVAAIASDITAVAGITSNVTTVAGISSNVTTVAGISSAVSSVASNNTNVSTVATNIASVNTNATNIVAIQNASTNATNAASSATAAAGSATSAAGSATSAANSAAAAASALDSFDDRYLGTKTSDPTLDNDGNALVAGALYFSTTQNVMKVYDGASWITATSAGATSLLRFRYVATSGQTTFSGADAASATLTYTVNNIAVHRNGVTLDTSEYTASNGTSIVLNVAAGTGDIVDIIAFKSFTVADALSAVSGGTVNGAVTVTGALTANGNVILGDASTDTLNVGNGGLVKDASGNVGIGVTNPSAKLSVSSGATVNMFFASTTGTNTYTPTASTSLLSANWQIQAGNASGACTGIRLSQGSNFELFLGGVQESGGAGAFVFQGYNGTSYAERVRITSGGELLVGTTSSVSSSGRLQSIQTQQTSAGLSVDATNASFDYKVVYLNTTRAASSAFDFIQSTTGGYGAVQFRVRGDGVIFAQNTTVQSISDVRVKENVRDAVEGLQTVLGLRPVRFDFKEGFGNNRKNQLGFIAQEVEEVFPDAVDVAGELDENGDPYKSVGPSAMIPTLVKAIQEQQAIIVTMREELDVLKAKVGA